MLVATEICKTTLRNTIATAKTIMIFKIDQAQDFIREQISVILPG